jgi:hypothetical protein
MADKRIATASILQKQSQPSLLLFKREFGWCRVMGSLK